MTERDYRIYPDWKDVLVYDEGEGRTLRLDCAQVEPYQVSVPSWDWWVAKTPPWAHDRREIILQRLREANCIIREESEHVSAIHSPDGTFRVEIYYEMDERGHVSRWIRIVMSGDDRELVHFYDAGIDGLIRFPAVGIVTIPFRIEDRRHQIGVNTRDGTYWFHPMDEPQPLAQLPAELQAQRPRVIFNPVLKPTTRKILGAIGMLLACIAFVAGGIWMAICGHSSKDRIIGAFGALFFGLCAAPAVIDLRAWLSRR